MTYGNLSVDQLTSSTGQSLSPASSSATMKNRIINGGMTIDQRNNGGLISNSTSYTVDRWSDGHNGSGQYSAQQVTNAPVGFTNSLVHTVTTAVTSASTDVYQLFQPIEGFNIADLGWGTANAKSITVSFWVQASIVGSYAFSIQNGSQARSYVTTFNVPTANTWTYISVTIPGDTTGTWNINNTVGLYLIFDLGSGSNYNTTPNAWQSGQFRRTSSTVNFISTLGATFYITGVQLEVGTVASSFDYRDYGSELIMCQRYYQGSSGFVYTAHPASIYARINYYLPVSMRTTPSVSYTDGAGNASKYTSYSTSDVGTNNVAPIAFTGVTGTANNIIEITLNNTDTGVNTGLYYYCNAEL